MTAERKKPLWELAEAINRKFKNLTTGYVEIGRMLIEARGRVRKETKWKWREWCKVNLRKRNGKPFSQKTLENYIYLARDPKRLDKQRSMQRKNIQRVRSKAKGIETADAVAQLFTKNAPVAEQVNILMTAWEYASETAQQQFLGHIGARL